MYKIPPLGGFFSQPKAYFMYQKASHRATYLLAFISSGGKVQINLEFTLRLSNLDIYRVIFF